MGTSNESAEKDCADLLIWDGHSVSACGFISIDPKCARSNTDEIGYASYQRSGPSSTQK